ncbi:MAG: vWA domain-containing protein [Pseudomonadota bacterium]
MSQDIRILIDVSGSMKKNDPQNLRSPALRLLVGLLPPDSSAGVWNFGTKVKELVQSSKIDEQWKEKARKASKKIHSRDLFTNIGQALNTASQDWLNNKKVVEPGNRNIILLTDGMVDISKDDAKNQLERKRILSELLPRISEKQVQINTIALSDKADFEFLKKLSTTSDGNFEQADNAEALERIFLHLFEKTVKPDTLPLIENKFIVDDSVYEMTLLVFKDKTAENQTTEIVEPSGNTFTQQTAPRYVKWQSENNYDLLTIQKPFVGDWQINASIDPDNRVMVVTNLKIQTNFLPNNVYLGETIDLQVFLKDQKEIITNDEFLHLTSISIIQSGTEDRPAKKWFLHDNGLRGDKQENDGRFDVKLGKNFKPGKNPFIIRASSETFARELQQVFSVHDIPLLAAELEVIENGASSLKRVRVSPNLEYLNPKNIKISAELFSQNKKPLRVSLKNDNAKQIEWYFEADNLDPDEDYYIVFHLQSHTRRGRLINYSSKKIQLNLNKIITDAILSGSESKEVNPIKVTISKTKADKKVKTLFPIGSKGKNDSVKIEQTGDIESINSDKIDWTMAIIITVVVNLIAILLGWFFYRRWKKNQDVDLIDLSGDMS